MQGQKAGADNPLATELMTFLDKVQLCFTECGLPSSCGGRTGSTSILSLTSCLNNVLLRPILRFKWLAIASDYLIILVFWVILGGYDSSSALFSKASYWCLRFVIVVSHLEFSVTIVRYIVWCDIISSHNIITRSYDLIPNLNPGFGTMFPWSSCVWSGWAI